jgi:hypothetical protein
MKIELLDEPRTTQIVHQNRLKRFKGLHAEASAEKETDARPGTDVAISPIAMSMQCTSSRRSDEYVRY